MVQLMIFRFRVSSINYRFFDVFPGRSIPLGQRNYSYWRLLVS